MCLHEGSPRVLSSWHTCGSGSHLPKHPGSQQIGRCSRSISQREGGSERAKCPGQPHSDRCRRSICCGPAGARPSMGQGGGWDSAARRPRLGQNTTQSQVGGAAQRRLLRGSQCRTPVLGRGPGSHLCLLEGMATIPGSLWGLNSPGQHHHNHPRTSHFQNAPDISSWHNWGLGGMQGALGILWAEARSAPHLDSPSPEAIRTQAESSLQGTTGYLAQTRKGFPLVLQPQAQVGQDGRPRAQGVDTVQACRDIHSALQGQGKTQCAACFDPRAGPDCLTLGSGVSSHSRCSSPPPWESTPSPGII